MSEMSNLKPVQAEIYKAISQMKEKASFTEFQIVKKIRENTKFDGKKKAGLSLDDMLIAWECLRNEGVYYSIHINSVNECLFKKEDEDKGELQLEAKQRRRKSEKSMTILTSGDFTSGAGKGGKSAGKNHEKRNNRQKLSTRFLQEDELQG